MYVACLFFCLSELSTCPFFLTLPDPTRHVTDPTQPDPIRVSTRPVDNSALCRYVSLESRDSLKH